MADKKNQEEEEELNPKYFTHNSKCFLFFGNKSVYIALLTAHHPSQFLLILPQSSNYRD